MHEFLIKVLKNVYEECLVKFMNKTYVSILKHFKTKWIIHFSSKKQFKNKTVKFSI